MKVSDFLPVGCDIETIPPQGVELIESLKIKLAGKVSAPDLNKAQLIEVIKERTEYPTAGLTVPQLKELYMKEFAGELVMNQFDNEYRKLSFNALEGGEVISVSAYPFWSNQGASTRFRWLEPGTPESNGMPVECGPTEAELIDVYFKYLNKLHQFATANRRKLLIVGANVKGFDFKFLARRAMHLGVDLPEFPLADASFISKTYFDVIEIFGFFDRQDRVSLDKICKFLGVETSKDDEIGHIDGSMVYDIWANDGKAGAERIAKYNGRDCVVLEKIFEKLHPLVA